MKRLSRKRYDVLEAFRDLQAEKGARPTYKEIAQRCDMSPSTARDHVRELRLRGILKGGRAPIKELSEVQSKTLKFICINKLIHKRTPRLKDIAEAVGISNLSLVRKVLIALEMKGYLQKPYRKKRAIQVKELPDSMIDELSKLTDEYGV